MITHTREPDSKLLITIATGKLEQGDHGWMLEMRRLDGWNAGAAWRDVKFNLRHAANFERVATVGEKEWREGLARLMKPSAAATVRHFEPDRRAEVLTWLCE